MVSACSRSPAGSGAQKCGEHSEMEVRCGVMIGLLVKRRLTDVVAFDPHRGVGLDQTPLRVATTTSARCTIADVRPRRGTAATELRATQRVDRRLKLLHYASARNSFSSSASVIGASPL